MSSFPFVQNTKLTIHTNIKVKKEVKAQGIKSTGKIISNICSVKQCGMYKAWFMQL